MNFSDENELKKYVLNKLAEYKMKSSGWAPFGPLDDLVQLHEWLGKEKEESFFKILKDLEVTNEFWKDYIVMFFEREFLPQINLN